MKSIVLASSRGIGKAIADEFKLLNHEVVSTSSDILDTSNMESVESFVSQNNDTDILVLNTGGPPAKDFYDIKREEWMKYYYQLFYSFVYMLQILKLEIVGIYFLYPLLILKNLIQN